MSRRAKLLTRIRQNPKNVSFHDMQTLLESFGFELKRTRGSHHSFVGMVAGQKSLLVIPYHRPLDVTYVRKALALIEQLEIEDE